MPNSDPPDNIFIRFKQKVDGHIASAFQRFLGVPTVVTHNLQGRWPEPPQSLNNNDRRNNADDLSVQPRTPSSQVPQPTVFEVFSAMSPMQALFRAEEFTESLYQAMWISFLIESPYSPLALRDMPQPRPTDLPADGDPTLFGFEDAFEDLLMVSSGHGLPDIHERHRVKKEWREQFPTGLPPILWLHQLTRQGLWGGWAPRPEMLERAISERWQRWLREQDDPFHERSGLPAGRQTSSEEIEVPKESGVKQPEGAAADEPRRLPEAEHRETEEDSYFSVMGQARSSGSRQTDGGKSYSSTRDLSPRGLPSGWRVVENVQKRDDGNGHVSVTKTVTTFNDKGKEVGREIERRSDYIWSTSFSTGGNGDSSSSSSSSKKDQRQKNDMDGNSSWFWK